MGLQEEFPAFLNDNVLNVKQLLTPPLITGGSAEHIFI